MNVPFVDLVALHEDVKHSMNRALLTVAAEGSYILGKHVERFESSFAVYSGTKYGIGVANGTEAILLVLRALDIGPGDEVITTPYSFIATALPITYAGATPVFADIEPNTYTIDPELVEAKITKKTRAIIAVALYGQSPLLSQLSRIAKSHGVPLIIDAAQAHGALYKGKPIAAWAHTSTFSFYPAKNLGAYGDGGAITTNSASLDKKLRILRNVGRDGWYVHVAKGYNSRLDNIQAAILNIKLKKLDKWNAMRLTAARRYEQLLSHLPITLPQSTGDGHHVYHLYVIRSKNRDELQKHLAKHNIASGVHYPIPIHLQPAYRELGYKRGDFPQSEVASRNVLSLPFFPHMKKEQQEYVADVMTKYFSKGKK